ncbi:MAG TPA: hydantoinase/oxoprolinase family protein [Baekduia sp.]|nr:hydantoinase/oxoprolinase family protein [Baekduia sp.]
MLLGVDVGGTFTDAVLVDGDRIFTAKAPTTGDQSEGVLTAVRQTLAAAERLPSEVTVFAHGMTVATNALLEGHGARTAFVATKGFTDIVELGRQARPHLYRLCEAGPAPLAPPERRFGADERTGPGGVISPLNGIDALTAALIETEPEAVAICLLHSYAHPGHEQELGRALAAALPGVHVSLSHEVTATFREFERAATTEIDAALSPLLRDYLVALADACAATELPAPQIMQSSGGLTDVHHAAAHAATTVLSGPAGGAAAAALLSTRIDEGNLLCFDMGGTSCDVSLLTEGQVGRSSGREIGGRPLALPTVDIHTVGAGGGSIAWRDAGGALRVGPQSAGAQPGPAAYGRGGTLPTVTDADLVLGRLPATIGDIDLDRDAARQAIGALADTLGLDVEACAAGIVRVADAEMVRALRVVSVERGLDPRDFALLAFGGAGPLHACAIAELLGITDVIVAHQAGVLSALGLAAADRRHDRAQTVMLEDFTDADIAGLAQGDEMVWEARYRGQSHELALRDIAPSADAIRTAFHREHERLYGYREANAPIQLVTVRTADIDPGPELVLATEPGETLTGPATIALPGCTLFVAAGWQATDDGLVWRLRWIR